MIGQPDTPLLEALRELAGDVDRSAYAIVERGGGLSPATLWLQGLHDGLSVALKDPAVARALVEDMSVIPLRGEDFGKLLEHQLEVLRAGARRGAQA